MCNYVVIWPICVHWHLYKGSGLKLTTYTGLLSQPSLRLKIPVCFSAKRNEFHRTLAKNHHPTLVSWADGGLLIVVLRSPGVNRWTRPSKQNCSLRVQVFSNLCVVLLTYVSPEPWIKQKTKQIQKLIDEKNCESWSRWYHVCQPTSGKPSKEQQACQPELANKLTTNYELMSCHEQTALVTHWVASAPDSTPIPKLMFIQ